MIDGREMSNQEENCVIFHTALVFGIPLYAIVRDFYFETPTSFYLSITRTLRNYNVCGNVNLLSIIVVISCSPSIYKKACRTLPNLIYH